MYYISPQLWAWRSSRIKIIQKYVDQMAVVFPFEVQFYKDAGVPVEFVGHPLVKDAVCQIPRDEFLKNINLDPDKKIVGIFPGSRASEIENNFPILLQAAAELLNIREDTQFITPIASTLSQEFIQHFINNADIKITTTTSDIYDVINACDVIAAASGTVTLQITLMQTPMLIIYKISPITYRILKNIVKFTYAGIANVIAEKEICREFIQDNATSKEIALEMEKLIVDENYISTMKKEMSKIKERLGERDGSAVAAELAVNLIAGK